MSYEMMLRVWEKQKNGDRLFDKEIKWKDIDQKQ